MIATPLLSPPSAAAKNLLSKTLRTICNCSNRDLLSSAAAFANSLAIRVGRGRRRLETKHPPGPRTARSQRFGVSGRPAGEDGADGMGLSVGHGAAGVG